MEKTITISLSEYEKLKKDASSNIINHDGWSLQNLYEIEVAKLKVYLSAIKNPKKYKHDLVQFPGVGEFSIKELKKEYDKL